MVGVGFGGSYNWVKHTLSSFSTLVVPYFHLNEYTYQHTFSDVNKIEKHPIWLATFDLVALKQTKEIPLFQLLHCFEKPFSALEKCIPFDRRGLSKDRQQKLVPQVTF